MTRIPTKNEGAAAQLPREFVVFLIECSENDEMLTVADVYRQGDRVNVINGPFAVWLADFISADVADRVVLLLDLKGRKSAVQLPGYDVRKRKAASRS